MGSMFTICSLCLFGISLLQFLIGTVTCSSNKPNFVIVIADDLGIGDVGIFGNDTLKTPNIDSISKQGARLSHHLAAASVCTPSRAALLTGRYPIRTGLTTQGRNRVIMFIASFSGLPSNETTFATLLQKQGYKTALIGKWHLGIDCEQKNDRCHHPLNHGFDYFYGLPLTNCKDFGDDGASVVTTYYPNFYVLLGTISTLGASISIVCYRNHYRFLFALLLFLSVVPPGCIVLFVRNIKVINSVLMRNNEVVEQPVRFTGLTGRLVQESKEFIEQQAINKQPFLLVLSFIHVHTALFPSPQFVGTSKYGKYGDCVHELDWAVGEILGILDSAHLKNDTFVYFTSDNGGHIEEYSLDGVREGGYNGIFKGGKAMGGVEGGIRVPTAVMWPGKVPAGLEISVPTSQMDLFPTILHIAGLQLPEDRIIDGKTLLPLLSGQSHKSPHKFLFHYCGSYLQAVRYIPINESDVWKMYFSTPKWINGTDRCAFVCQCYGSHIDHHNPPLLYNMDKDPSETKPINHISNPKYKEIHSIINDAVKSHQKTIQVVPQQMNFVHSMWRPWLQPCCNFPFCSCFDQKYS